MPPNNNKIPIPISTEIFRCLQCFNAPCQEVCPTHIPIPRFIGMIRSGNILGAAEEIKSANCLANICGKICPEEIYCQAVCTRGKIDEPILIRELHDFATTFEADYGFRKPKIPESPAKKPEVAIIGAGSAGVSCAYELLKLGVSADLYDILEKPGGIPAHLVPQWRIAAKNLAFDIDFLLSYISKPKFLSEALSITKLRTKYKAIFLATGLWLDRRLEINGEKMPDVYHGIDYLALSRSSPASFSHYRQVVVIGGGNVSLDVATTAKKLGAEDVTLTYRRSPRELKTWKAEKKAAEQAGIQFVFQLQPIAILGIDNRVKALLCQRTKMLNKLDKSKRRIAVPDETTRVEIPADAVIVSIGQDSSFQLDLPIKQNSIGGVEVDKNFATNVPGIFAGGDLVRGEGTVVQAVADGQNAAHAITEFLQNKK